LGTRKYKVLIVDDSFTVRQALEEILVSDPELEVIAAVGDAITAAEKIREEPPDVITLDIEMPHMDGLTFLRMVMALRPIPVVICSSKVDRTKTAMLALEYGAVEVIFKPQANIRNFMQESRITLCDAVKAAARADLGKRISKAVSTEKDAGPGLMAVAAKKSGDFRSSAEKIIVVGASTGGTDALRVFLKGLPADAPGIVVVQHMPEHFTRGFAERLNTICPMSVKEAENNDKVTRGQVLIAPGNRHTLLKRGVGGYYVEVKDSIGVIMTGMGDDGAAGMREMRENGAYTIAQDEATCTIFGMPNEAIKQGGVATVLPLEDIARRVLEIC